jgi:hypothetical protein
LMHARRTADRAPVSWFEMGAVDPGHASKRISDVR